MEATIKSKGNVLKQPQSEARAVGEALEQCPQPSQGASSSQPLCTFGHPGWAQTDVEQGVASRPLAEGQEAESGQVGPSARGIAGKQPIFVSLLRVCVDLAQPISAQHASREVP